jgi:UDP-N-acetylglucosamine acyltransferase
MSDTSTHAPDIRVDPRAVVDPQAQLAAGVSIGPFTTVGPNVVVGRNTTIGSSCVIAGRTSIGADCEIFTGAVIGSIPQDLKYDGAPGQLIIGDRNRIREYVTMNIGTRNGGNKTIVGSDNLFMAYAHVAHDCIVGNHCVLANCGTLAGHIVMEDHAILGGLAAVHQFCRIGTYAIIGGCSKVVQDVPPFASCDGHPARIFGLNVEGLRRAKFSIEARKVLKQAFRLLFQSQLTNAHAIGRIERELPQTPEIAHVIAFVCATKRGMCRSSTERH